MKFNSWHRDLRRTSDRDPRITGWLSSAKKAYAFFTGSREDSVSLKRGFLAAYVFYLAEAKTTGGLLEIVKEYRRLLDESWEVNEFLLSKQTVLAEDRSGRKWSPEEDGKLVEMRSEGKGIVLIGNMIGRSPQAVATRLSYLIGIRREVIRVNGKRIEGFLDDAYANGNFEGVVYQE